MKHAVLQDIRPKLLSACFSPKDTFYYLYESTKSLHEQTFHVLQRRTLAGIVYVVIITLWTLVMVLLSMTIVYQFWKWLTKLKPNIYCQWTDRNQTIVKQCTALRKYKPSWFLCSGHFQTMYSAIMNRYPEPDIAYEREIVAMEDGGEVSLDWAHPKDTERCYEVPTVLVLHGLTGSSDELYIREYACKLNTQGWRVVVLNARGCGNTPLKTPLSFCAAYTNDVREVVLYLRQCKVKSMPLIGTGFSLGANILVKYLGETSHAPLLTAAISIGNPFNLQETSRHLRESWFHKVVYNYALAKNLREKAVEFVPAFKDHPTLNIQHALQAATVEEFDDVFTKFVFGYDTVRSYYCAGSSDAYVSKVKIPLLCISAMDDPVCVSSAIPFDDCLANQNVILVTAKRGGHLGYFENSNMLHPTSWIPKVSTEYCEAILDMAVSKQVHLHCGVFNSQMDQIADDCQLKDEADNCQLGDVADDCRSNDEASECHVERETNDKIIDNTRATTETLVAHEHVQSTDTDNTNDTMMEVEEQWNDGSTCVAIASMAIAAYGVYSGRRAFRKFF